MLRIKELSIFGVLVALLLHIDLGAFSLSPMVLNFTPQGRDASQALVLNNPSQAIEAVELEAFVREYDENGNEQIQTSAEDEFMIYPSQVILHPGQNQRVRVVWLGNPTPNHELAFRLVASQVPINLEEEASDTISTQLQIMLTYVASMYITPDKAEANLFITSVEHKKSEDGSDILSIEIENQGFAHAMVRDSVIEIVPLADNGHLMTDLAIIVEADGIHKDTFGPILSSNILAKDKILFEIPWPKDLPTGRVQARIRPR